MMSVAYPGVFRTSWEYLAESSLALLKISILMAVVCSATLLGFVSAQNEITMYSLFAFGGLVLYLSQLSLERESDEADQHESRALTVLLTALAVLYYNTVLFLSVFFGLAFSLSGHPSIAIAVAALYPIYDAEMAETGWPISVAGAVVMTIGIIGFVAELLEERTERYYHYDVIRRVSGLRTWKTAIQDTLTRLLNEKIGIRRSGKPV
jgi:hypothetical protein